MLFWPKTGVPEYNSGRKCCSPYLIGQHSFSPVFGQTRPGAPGYCYFAQLPPDFGHFMFPFGRLLEQTNTGHKKQLTGKFRPCDVEIDKIFLFFFKQFWAQPFPPCLSGGCSEGSDSFRLTITPARTTTRRTYNQMSTERGMDSR